MSLREDIYGMIVENGGPATLAAMLEHEWRKKQTISKKTRLLQKQTASSAEVIRALWDTKNLDYIADFLKWSRYKVSREAIFLGLPPKKHIFAIFPNQRAYKTLDVLDLETGIYYDNAKEAAKAKGVNYRTLEGYLNGDRKNKTSLIKIKDNESKSATGERR